MTHLPRRIAAVALAAALFAPTAARAQTPCIAVPLPSVRGAEGSATELATAVRDLVLSYLTGPSLRAVALDARLAAQALEEARQKECGTVLTITVTRKKSGGSGFGRALGDAAGAAAWHVPYGHSAASTAARGAAMAGSAAVSSLASNTRVKDELLIEYRLSANGRTALREGRDSAKAKSDGEDLVTQLVERMATATADAVAEARK
jgi:hypothetical protein